MSRGPDKKYLSTVNWIQSGIDKYGSLQNFAEALGWNKRKACICKQTSPDIAPNGSRRERRINNGFVDCKEDPILLVFREFRRTRYINEMHEEYKKLENLKEEK